MVVQGRDKKMSELKNQISKYAKEFYEIDDKKVEKPNPRDIALIIATYAHREQKRVNGEPYITHPISIENFYYDLLWKYPNPYKTEAMKDNDLPTIGIGETMLLHDVVEDTSITHEDIRNLFYEWNWGEYFDLFIDEPLRVITHDKNDDYDTYIAKVLENKEAALVKAFDLMDNTNLLTLDKLTDKEYERALKYLKYFKMINDKYHFVEKICNYRKDIM